MSTIPINFAVDKQTGLPFFPVTHVNAVRDDNGTPLPDLLDCKSTGHATCSTAAATAAKEVTVSDFVLSAGKSLVVKFTNGISVASPTLAVTYTDKDNVQQTSDPIPIYYRGEALGAYMVKAGASVILDYNGTQFDVIGDMTPSGFKITHNNTTGADQFEAIGSATLEHDDTTGADKFTL